MLEKEPSDTVSVKASLPPKGHNACPTCEVYDGHMQFDLEQEV